MRKPLSYRSGWGYLQPQGLGKQGETCDCPGPFAAHATKPLGKLRTSGRWKSKSAPLKSTSVADRTRSSVELKKFVHATGQTKALNLERNAQTRVVGQEWKITVH